MLRSASPTGHHSCTYFSRIIGTCQKLSENSTSAMGNVAKGAVTHVQTFMQLVSLFIPREML